MSCPLCHKVKLDVQRVEKILARAKIMLVDPQGRPVRVQSVMPPSRLQLFHFVEVAVEFKKAS